MLAMSSGAAEVRRDHQPAARRTRSSQTPAGSEKSRCGSRPTAVSVPICAGVGAEHQDRDERQPELGRPGRRRPRSSGRATAAGSRRRRAAAAGSTGQRNGAGRAARPCRAMVPARRPSRSARRVGRAADAAATGALP